MVPRSDCPNTEPDSAAHRTIAANEKRTRILRPLPTKTKQSDVCSAAIYDVSTNVAVSLVAILLVVGMIVGTAIGQQAPCATPDIPKPFRWPDGKRAAVSLSFNDARVSQIDAGLALLNRQHVKVTFFVQAENIRK